MASNFVKGIGPMREAALSMRVGAGEGQVQVLLKVGEHVDNGGDCAASGWR